MTEGRTRLPPRVADLMSSPAITIEHRAHAYRAVGLLRDYGIRHLPVLREGTLVGMISERDLLPRRDPVGEVMAGDPLDIEVGALMCCSPIVIGPADAVTLAIQKMLEHDIGALPVVAPGSGELLGVVSYVDVLRVVADAGWAPAA